MKQELLDEIIDRKARVLIDANEFEGLVNIKNYEDMRKIIIEELEHASIMGYLDELFEDLDSEKDIDEWQDRFTDLVDKVYEYLVKEDIEIKQKILSMLGNEYKSDGKIVVVNEKEKEDIIDDLCAAWTAGNFEDYKLSSDKFLSIVNNMIIIK